MWRQDSTSGCGNLKLPWIQSNKNRYDWKHEEEGMKSTNDQKADGYNVDEFFFLCQFVWLPMTRYYFKLISRWQVLWMKDKRRERDYWLINEKSNLEISREQEREKKYPVVGVCAMYVIYWSFLVFLKLHHEVKVKSITWKLALPVYLNRYVLTLFIKKTPKDYVLTMSQHHQHLD